MKILAWPAFSTRSKNPYCHLLYTHTRAQVVEFSWSAALRGRYDIFHVHWPERALSRKSAASAFFRLKCVLVLIAYLRSKGTRIVWTAHNLGSHENHHPRLESWFWRSFTASLDGFVALSTGGLQLGRERFPSLRNIPGFVVPHGHYRGEYPDCDRSVARSVLGIPAGSMVILNFGKIRAYKNVGTLIGAFRQLPDPDLVLIVAGDCKDVTLAHDICSLADGDSRIRLELRAVPAARVAYYMRAADMMVLPYRDILNSGTALLGLSFDCPVAVSGRGAMPELASLVGHRWVHLIPGDLTSQSLEDCLEWLQGTDRGTVAPLESLQWPALAEQFLAAMRQIAGAERRPVNS